GEASRIRGNITALSAVVEGVVIGDITAPKGITLLSTSAIIGDMTTGRLQIEDDVIVHGHCISLKEER
ncbi:MAG: polymer-forming cytoskeletal protein, partial [Treponemataceae bacterium]|nr:polymer-forming cytoskeletal protein [Treponemataceae bacterium]